MLRSFLILNYKITAPFLNLIRLWDVSSKMPIYGWINLWNFGKRPKCKGKGVDRFHGWNPLEIF